MIGHIGEIKNRVGREFKLTSGTAVFELDLRLILEKAKGAMHKDYRVSQYPSVSRDVTLTVQLSTEYISLEKQICGVYESRDYIYKVSCTSIYQADGSKTKNVSFHLVFANPSKTLEKDEINAIMAEVESIK